MTIIQLTQNLPLKSNQKKLKPRKVNPIGPRNSKIVIIGDLPSKEESETGIPFTSSSGHLLTQLLNQVGIDRSKCYCTLLIKYRPPSGLISRIDEIDYSLLQAQEELRAEIASLNPNIILVLGELSLEAITGLNSISKHRGSILKSLPSIGEKKVIPTFSPSYIQRMYRSSALVLFDLLKVKNESVFSSFKSIPKREFKINPSFSESLALLDRFSKSPALALDIETDRGACRLSFICWVYSFH